MTKKVCVVCGAQFTRRGRKETDDRWARRRFCSMRCAGRGPAAQLDMVPALGAQRRIRALQAIGYDFVRIAAAAGFSDRHIKGILRKTAILRTTNTKITAAYDDLHWTRGPSRRAETMGRRWPRPAWWLTHDIDAPDATSPDVTSTTRRPIDPGEVIELLEMGWQVGQVAAAFHVGGHRIRRVLADAGRSDVWVTATAREQRRSA